MVLSSTHIRLTRTSSDLRVLSDVLLPPSPILKADGFLISSTSGEIPLLLEATTHVCNSPLPIFGGPPSLRDVDKELKLFDKLGITVQNTRNLTRTNETPFQEFDDTYATPESPNERHEAESPSNSRPAEAIFSKSKTGIHPVYDDVLGDDAERSSMLAGHAMPMLVKRDGFKGSQDSRASCPNTMELDTFTVSPEEDLDGNQLLIIATFHTYSTLPTPTFAPPSPSSSADVISPSPSLVGRPRHRRPLERARAVRFPGRPRSPRLQANEAESNLLRAPPPSTKCASYSSPQCQLADFMPPATTPSRLPDTCVSDAAHPFTKHAGLPDELSWIKNVTIEMWIDQEGFRAVKSRMQLMGYSPRTRSLHPYESAEDAESCVAAGVAEFMPTKREAFAFHYATLDSPPTLRMVSVAGDEARDYISRQAALSVKANGVYTVLGTESFIASILNGDSHGLRLHWKLDYLVSDRKVDCTGKVLQGEKTLTPLTFSCSPYLFHPLQGKKTGLMHIMKKNLVPKLGSQKLEPPSYVPNQDTLGLPPVSRYLSIGRDATHTRSRSDAVGKSGYYSLTRAPLDTGVRGGTVLGTNHVPRARRRRASSAGENSLTCRGNEHRFGRGGIVALGQGTFMPELTVLR